MAGYAMTGRQHLRTNAIGRGAPSPRRVVLRSLWGLNREVSVQAAPGHVAGGLPGRVRRCESSVGNGTAGAVDVTPLVGHPVRRRTSSANEGTPALPRASSRPFSVLGARRLAVAWLLSSVITMEGARSSRSRRKSVG